MCAEYVTIHSLLKWDIAQNDCSPADASVHKLDIGAVKKENIQCIRHIHLSSAHSYEKETSSRLWL